MAPVKWKLINKFLAKKYKALKDLENGLSNKDIATKYGVLLKTPYQQSHSLNCTARLSHLLHVWVILIFFAKFIRPGSIEDEDDGEDNDDDLNDNIDDLDCPPPLTRPSKWDIEEALDKLQDPSLFSSHRDEIRSLTLKIETFLNKEQTEGWKQSNLTDLFQVVN